MGTSAVGGQIVGRKWMTEGRGSEAEQDPSAGPRRVLELRARSGARDGASGRSPASRRTGRHRTPTARGCTGAPRDIARPAAEVSNCPAGARADHLSKGGESRLALSACHSGVFGQVSVTTAIASLAAPAVCRSARAGAGTNSTLRRPDSGRLRRGHIHRRRHPTMTAYLARSPYPLLHNRFVWRHH